MLPHFSFLISYFSFLIFLRVQWLRFLLENDSPNFSDSVYQNCLIFISIVTSNHSPNMKYLLKLVSGILLLTAAQAQQKRPVSPIDIYRMQNISDPHVSPDGKWIIYVLSTVDTAKDKRNSDIWMTSWDGKENIQITNSPDDESAPRFSPDGKYISFTASRGTGDEKEEKKSQIYLLDRRGGEAGQGR